MTATHHLRDPQTLYRHWEHEQWNPWRHPRATAPTSKRSAPSGDAIRQFALDGLTRRLNVIGVPLETLTS